jgi:hypothetical protein
MKVPRLKWRANDQDWQTGSMPKMYWYEEFNNNTAIIELEKPQEMNIELFLDAIKIKSNKGKYLLGEVLFSQEIVIQKKPFILWVELNEEKLKLCDISTKTFFERPPTLIKTDAGLYWRCDEVFIGKNNSIFNITLNNKYGTVLNKTISSFHTNLVIENSLPDGIYELIVGIKENAFSAEMEIIHNEKKIFGDYEKVRFNDVCFVISEIINANNQTIDIKTVVVENIYFDREDNGFNFYKGNLVTKKFSGEKIFVNMQNASGNWIRINPVMIEMKDSSTFWLTFYDNDEDAWIDFTVDKSKSVLSIQTGKKEQFDGVNICKYNIANSIKEVEIRSPNYDKNLKIWQEKPELKKTISKTVFRTYDTNNLNTPIENLNLSVRAYNSLRRARCYTAEDLSKKTYSDLLKIRNLGAKCANEIIEKLAKLNIKISEE